MSVTNVQAPMLELKAKVDPKGESEAVVALRWCVSRELTELMERHNIARPFLMLVVRPYTTHSYAGKEVRTYADETSRKFIPLTQEWQTVSFMRPGLNSVFATIVWAENGEGAWYLKRSLQPGSGFMDAIAFDYEGELHRKRNYSVFSRGSTYTSNVLYEVTDEITMDVPKEMFAKEPPQWLKDYTGKFFNSRGHDQCGFRKRSIPAVLFAPFYFPLAYILRVFQTVIGVVLGMRKMEFRSFVHPLKYSVVDVLEYSEAPVWWFDKQGRRRGWWQLLLNPVTPMILGLAIFGISTVNTTRGEQVVDFIGWGWWQCLAVSVLLHLVPLVLVLITGLLVFLIGILPFSFLKTLLQRRTSSQRQTRDEKRASKLKAQMETTRHELEQMICSTASRNTSLAALPKQKQTFRLRIQETKTRVCKPYAR